MKIKVINDVKKSKDIKFNILSKKIDGDIFIWRDGGVGDVLIAYSVIKDLKRKFQNFNLKLSYPHGPFADFFKNNTFCELKPKPYREIYGIMHSFKNKYEGFINLRPRTFALYNDQKFNDSSLKEHIEITTQRQLKEYGNEFLKNPSKAAENRLYGDGDMYFKDVYNYIHNLNIDFNDSKESIINNDSFKNYETPKYPYITLHQWAYTGAHNYNSKFWPYDYWIELSRLINKNLNIPMMQVGKSNEKIMDSTYINNYLGKTNIFESIKLISNSVIHIDIEGALVHCSALMNNKCISLCGPSMPYWRHYNCENIKYLYTDKECCNIFQCEKYRSDWHSKCINKHHNCLKNISPELVFENIKSHII